LEEKNRELLAELAHKAMLQDADGDHYVREHSVQFREHSVNVRELSNGFALRRSSLTRLRRKIGRFWQSWRTRPCCRMLMATGYPTFKKKGLKDVMRVSFSINESDR
jgi:hypothetical protein